MAITTSSSTSSSSTSVLTTALRSGAADRLGTDHHKPYASSTLWNPFSSHSAEKSRDLFLTLTPQTQKPHVSSLPFISIAPPKSEAACRDRPLETRVKDESPGVHHQEKTLSSEQESLVIPMARLKLKPVSPIRTRDEKRLLKLRGLSEQPCERHRDIQTERPRYSRRRAHRLLHGQQYQSVRSGPQLKTPKIDSDDEETGAMQQALDTFKPFGRKGHNPTDQFRKKRSPKLKQDDISYGSVEMWENPKLGRKNTLLDSIMDHNVLDERTLFSNKQTVYLSRIMRENSVMPPPIDRTRSRRGFVPDANSVLERQYIQENYHQSCSPFQRFAKDEAVFPGVYKKLMKGKRARLQHVKSMFSRKEKEEELVQLSCSRCFHSSAPLRGLTDQDPSLNHPVSQTTRRSVSATEDGTCAATRKREEDHSKVATCSKGLDRFMRLPVISSGSLENCEPISDSVIPDSSSNVHKHKVTVVSHSPRVSSKEAVILTKLKRESVLDQENSHHISAHFCDVLGKKNCRKCIEFCAKRFRMKVDDTLNKDQEFQPMTPPSTPGESGICIPTQALQKIVIRVKDDQGVMAVTSVGVNEDVTKGL